MVMMVRIEAICVLMEKSIGFNFRKEITGICDILFRSDCFTSVCETDTSVWIDCRSIFEITVYNGLVEVAGFL